MTLQQKLTQHGITLPTVVPPVAAYTPALIVAPGLIRTSGQLPISDGNLVATGHLGDNVTLETAQKGAELAALNALAAAATLVDINQITGVQAMTVFVASTPNFTDQALVANGASLLFGKLFDQPHIRSAVGVAALPLGAAVEIEVTFTYAK